MIKKALVVSIVLWFLQLYWFIFNDETYGHSQILGMAFIAIVELVFIGMAFSMQDELERFFNNEG